MTTDMQVQDRPRVNRRRRRGFSLIDLLIAFTVFSIAIVSALTIFPTTMKAIRKARLKVMATHMSQAAIESVVNNNFSAIVSSGPTPTVLTTIVNGSSESITYNTTINVTTVVANSLVDVVVVVSWTDNGVAQSITNETLIAAKP